MNQTEKIQQGQAFLVELTQKINEKKEEYDRIAIEIDEHIRMKGDELVRKVAAMNQLEGNPEQSVVFVQESLRRKEQELSAYREELDGYAREQSQLEETILEKEGRLNAIKDELDGYWLAMYKALLQEVILAKRSIEARSELLTVKAARLAQQQNRLNDQIRSFKAAQQELLSTQNG